MIFEALVPVVGRVGPEKVRRGPYLSSKKKMADLQSIKNRCSMASPGPWGWWEYTDSSGGWVGPDLVNVFGGDANCGIEGDRYTWGLSREEYQFDSGESILILDGNGGCGPFGPNSGGFAPYGPSGLTAANATFIAYSRSDIESLLAMIDQKQIPCGGKEAELCARFLEAQIPAWFQFPRVQAVLRSCAINIRQGRHLTT